MNKLKVLLVTVAFAFTTSAFAGGLVGVKVGNGDLTGDAASYTAGSTTYAAVSGSKDSQYGAIFAEYNFSDTPFSLGIEHVPFDADISLDGKGSTKDANVDNYNTLYVVASREAGAGTIYGKLGYSQADIGSVTTDAEVTVNSQSDSLEGIMVGAGIQSGELDNGFVVRGEVTYTEFDNISITTTSNGSTSVKKTADGDLVTITLGLAKSF